MTSQTTPWRLIGLLYLAGALAACQYAKIPWMLPGLQQLSSMSNLQQALLLSMVGFLGAIGGTVAGAICQQAGLVRTLQVGLLLAIAGAVFPVLLAQYPWLLLARLVESIGHMAIVVAVPTLLLQLAVARDRATVMTIWSCYFTLTFVVVALVAPLLLALGGWQALTMVHAVLLCVVLVMLSRLLPPDTQTDRVNATIGLHALATGQRRLLITPRLLIVPLTFFGYTLLFVALVSALPAMIADTARSVATLRIVLPACALLGMLLALCLRQRLQPWRVVEFAAPCLFVLGVGLSVLPASHPALVPVVLLQFPAARTTAGRAFSGRCPHCSAVLIRTSRWSMAGSSSSATSATFSRTTAAGARSGSVGLACAGSISLRPVRRWSGCATGALAARWQGRLICNPDSGELLQGTITVPTVITSSRRVVVS